jgi:hypothetical protein
MPTIFVTGKGNNTAQINVGSIQNPTSNILRQSETVITQEAPAIEPATRNPYGCVSPAKTRDGPIITAGKTYMITMNANRTNASDIYSLNSLTVGAGLLTDLQNTPSLLAQTAPLVWPNPIHLDNPESGASDYFVIKGDANCQFDLFSLQMYDYVLSGENLSRAANGNWPAPAANPTTSQVIDQNPYV